MNGTLVPSLGHLVIHRTYWALNEPMLFSAKNELGDLYFVSYTDITENGESWIATRISHKRLHDFETGLFEIRDMFLKAETGTITHVEYDDTQPERPVLRYLLPADEALLEYLPETGQATL